MDEITLKAYGKINIGLDVTGRRDDGYHLVDMVMQSVELHDSLTIRKNAKPEVILSCSNPAVPTGEGNLAFRAAQMIRQLCKIREGVDIHIDKHIPMAAGMAGGSTDAAAVILAMNELFELRLPLSGMDEIALALGADVPFCLRTGTWRSEGIGEKLTQLTDLPNSYVLIAAQDLEVSTKQVYEALDGLNAPFHPDMQAVLDAISREDVHLAAACMENILEQVTFEMHPHLKKVKSTMLSAGADGAAMTGSGPTIFGLFADKEKAQAALAYFKQHTEHGSPILTAFAGSCADRRQS